MFEQRKHFKGWITQSVLRVRSFKDSKTSWSVVTLFSEVTKCTAVPKKDQVLWQDVQSSELLTQCCETTAETTAFKNHLVNDLLSTVYFNCLRGSDTSNKTTSFVLNFPSWTRIDNDMHVSLHHTKTYVSKQKLRMTESPCTRRQAENFTSVSHGGFFFLHRNLRYVKSIAGGGFTQSSKFQSG